MAKGSENNKRDGQLLEERSKIEGELDDVMQEKLDTLGKIRDLMGVGGKLEKDIEAVTREGDDIEGVISSIRDEIRRVTLEIKRLHETALKQESSRDTSGLEDVESRRIEVHKQKTRLLKDLLLKERELDKVSARKTKVLDDYSKILGERSNLEEKLDEIAGREIKLKERKMDIESRIGKEIGDLTKEIYSMDSGLEGDRVKSMDRVLASRKKPPSTRDLLKESVLSAKKLPERKEGIKPSERKEGIKPSERKEGKDIEEEIKPSKREVKGAAKGFLGFFGGGKGKEVAELSGESIRLLQEIMPVLDDLLGKLPDDKIEEFSTTDDYEIYNELFEKVSNYNGAREQKEFINVNTKKVLEVIDNLLENLPDEEIERFSSSDNFKDYNRLLDMFGV